MTVSKALRGMFVFHFFMDMVFAVPLLVFPSQTLAFFGIVGEPLLARIIGAALVGIGGASLIERNSTKEAYNAMLTVKLLWSATASASLLYAAVASGNPALWILFLVFAIFCATWAWFKYYLS